MERSLLLQNNSSNNKKNKINKINKTINEKTLNKSQNEKTNNEKRLNKSQRESIETALAPGQKLSLIQGPPGTGKTFSIAHLVKEWLDRPDSSGNPNTGMALVTAPSNVGVDALLSQLQQLDVPAIRLGHESKIRQNLLSLSMESRLSDSKDNETNLISSDPQTRQNVKHATREAQESSKFHNAIRNHAMRDILGDARVLCCTCASSGSATLKNLEFDLVYEASQCQEPEALVPICRLSNNGLLVLAGDHCQLPPTVLSEKNVHYINDDENITNTTNSTNTTNTKQDEFGCNSLPHSQNPNPNNSPHPLKISLFERLARHHLEHTLVDTKSSTKHNTKVFLPKDSVSVSLLRTQYST
eukprot:GSMAST32.ASY1.ANO1.2452.1 assembled CDS